MGELGNWGWIAFWAVNAVTIVILVKCILNASKWSDSSSDKSGICADTKQCPCERVEGKESR